jgi:hypothetical protein
MRLVGEEDLRPGRRCHGAQQSVLPDEDGPPLRVGLQQVLLRLFQHEPQAMQTVQAATPAERQSEAPTDELPHDLPVPFA